MERFNAPLSEWVMRRFLLELDRVLKRGLRFDYQRVEEQLPFLRGQLNVMAQLRQPPGRDHHFHVRHDVYLPDRPENRLLKLALERVRVTTSMLTTGDWRKSSASCSQRFRRASTSQTTFANGALIASWPTTRRSNHGANSSSTA